MLQMVSMDQELSAAAYDSDLICLLAADLMAANRVKVQTSPEYEHPCEATWEPEGGWGARIV